jgi:hypothetical protein
LLLARPEREHQRRVELDPALGKPARQLHHQHGSAAVVVRTRCVNVEVLSRLRLGVKARGQRGRAHDLRRLAGQVQRVVVRGDVDPARAPSGKHGDHLPHLDVADDASLWLESIAVEAHLELRARPAEFVEDPLPGSADAACRRRGVGQRIARTERGQRRQ